MTMTFGWESCWDCPVALSRFLVVSAVGQGVTLGAGALWGARGKLIRVCCGLLAALSACSAALIAVGLYRSGIWWPVVVRGETPDLPSYNGIAWSREADLVMFVTYVSLAVLAVLCGRWIGRRVRGA